MPPSISCALSLYARFDEILNPPRGRFASPQTGESALRPAEAMPTSPLTGSDDHPRRTWKAPRSMRSRIRRHATFANVTAIIALIVACSGTGYAITITSSQIKDGAVTSRDIGNHQVKGLDVRANSIRSNEVAGLGRGDFASGVLQPRVLAATVQGDQKPAGQNVDIKRGYGYVGSRTTAHDHTGDYVVKFKRNISTCSLTGSIGGVGTNSIDSGQIGVQRAYQTTDSVYVMTRDYSGTMADLPFTVVVVCPS